MRVAAMMCRHIRTLVNYVCKTYVRCTYMCVIRICILHGQNKHASCFRTCSYAFRSKMYKVESKTYSYCIDTYICTHRCKCSIISVAQINSYYDYT